MKVLIAYDGTLHAKNVLRSWLEKVKKAGDELVVLHVFESLKFLDYDAGPNAEVTARKESLRHLEDARLIVEDSRAPRSCIVVSEGILEDEIIRYAETESVDILLCPQRYRSLIKKFKKALRKDGKEPVESALFDETGRLKMAAVGVQAA